MYSGGYEQKLHSNKFGFSLVKDTPMLMELGILFMLVVSMICEQPIMKYSRTERNG